VALATTSSSEASMARSRASVTSAPAPGSGNPRTNRLALSSLVASRRPTFICPGSKAVSVPGRPPAAQYRTASEPNWSSRPIGVTTLPLDLLIFLRSGSRIQPDRATCRHGSVPDPSSARSTVENSQVRMMSCACGRRSIG
jgi:hypothetical protein